ncbi:RQC-minor-2 family DNA-binding protein [Priestia megaterium]|uniref:RQC-minor-2 family DNA-binding protein n=1 Tax=Priestia megaterium TaxID=1404 RepID=UPI0022AB1A92|nr:RQC-minor-2 family DNA-binding protein [Priestia megaterium]MDH3170438.1 RQC-minor-2 family DNA-binding protein [Priestia megaterium]
MTKNELENYLGSIMKDYMFCARIHDSSKEEWIQHINKCFFKHPLISLYHRNADVIEAIEQSKKSPLLFIMKNPEQIAFWCNRIEIIMRPFRSLSSTAFERGFSDTEDTVLTVHGENEIIRLTSENRGLTVTYDVTNDAISLDDEYNVVLAAKRLSTTQRQLEEIIDENEEVIQKLLVFFKWKSLLDHHEVHIKEIQDKLCNLTTYQLNQRQFLQEKYPFLSFIQNVLQVKTPNANLEVGSIQWFSQWDFPDVTLLQETDKFTCYMGPSKIEKKLTEISAKIENELHQQRQNLLSTPLKIGQITFDSNQMLRLLTLIDTLKNTETQQSYVQILEGVSTNSIRQKELDKIPAFGLLNSVKRKRIVTYLQELQNYQLLKKEKKGFSLTPKGEAIRRLFEEESRRI